MSDEEVRAPADARRASVVLRRRRLGDEVDLCPVYGVDASALATRLSAESWAMTGRPDPVLARYDLPVRFVRRA
jgi:hypothetical protein